MLPLYEKYFGKTKAVSNKHKNFHCKVKGIFDGQITGGRENLPLSLAKYFEGLTRISGWHNHNYDTRIGPPHSQLPVQSKYALFVSLDCGTFLEIMNDATANIDHNFQK